MDQILNKLVNIETEKRNKARKVLLKIFHNILKNPNKHEYKQLNLSKINELFKDCKPCIELLFCAGFNRSNNGLHLVFDDTKLSELEQVSQILVTLKNHRLNDAHKSKSYHDKQNKIFGCKHYARNCFLKAECCNEWFVCRKCHDIEYQKQYSSSISNDNLHVNKPHQMDRYATQIVRCMKCATIQNASKYCINCKYCFGIYFCDICKYYDDTPDKPIFHCYKCRLCVLLINGTLQEHMQKDHQDPNQQVYIGYKRDALNTLLTMGFNQQISELALSSCNGDLASAISFITQDQEQKQSKLILPHRKQVTCNMNVKDCESVQIIINVIRTYDENKNNNNDEKTLINILDAFHHSLFHHDNDNDFKYIIHMLHQNCELQNCDKIKRHYRNEDNHLDNNEYDNVLFDQILDRIHCHFLHGFDIFRINETEMKQIENLDCNNDSNEDMEKAINSNIMQLQNVLNKKKLRFSKITNSNRFSNKKNKFCSLIVQSNSLQENDSKTNENQYEPSIYSYSYPFNYWKHCANSFQVAHDGITNIKDFYVKAKYNSIKDELLNNPIATISLLLFDQTMASAKVHQASYTCKSLRTANVLNYNYYKKESFYHPSKFGYTDGDIMSLSHLVAVIVYCAFDQLQAKFSATYRPVNSTDDDLNTIKERHQNFHHFAKSLYESVQVFGMQYMSGTIERMYHGINKKMIFTGMSSNVYCVLSTTSSWNVAVQFADTSGLILELIPHAHLKYFGCCWLAKYPNEQELLFCGGILDQPINFINITNTVNGDAFQMYVKALRIIDTMTAGLLFTEDYTLWIDSYQKSTIDVALLGRYADISTKIKKLAIMLIQHECSRYESDRYKTFPHLHPYVDKLLHQLCKNKKFVVIDMDSMNNSIYSKLQRGGYIGYSFLKSYICSKEYEGVNLSILHLLFPAMHYLMILRLTTISSYLLNDIWKALKTNKSLRIIVVELRIQTKYGSANIDEQIKNYDMLFADIGYSICHKTKGDELLFIKRLENPFYHIER
eukprot:438524_1